MGDQRYGTASTGHTTAFTRKKRNIGPETQFTLRVAVPVFFLLFFLSTLKLHGFAISSFSSKKSFLLRFASSQQKQ